MILHIALPEDWAAARAAGHYTVSTRGATVDRVGFLHASEDAAQVGIVGPAVYADRPDAVVLAMDEAALEAAGLTVRRERGVPGDPHSPLFPHVYGGPVPVALITPLPRADVDPRVVREDDAEAIRLQDAGWTQASTSWGARLHLADDADLAPYERRVAAVRAAGFQVRRLTPDDVGQVRRLDGETAADYPATAASSHSPLPEDLAVRLTLPGHRGYGAFRDGVLAGFTLLDRLDDRWDVDRTAVHPTGRRRGLAAAVKALSVLETHREDGARTWGTGGAGANAGSLAMNRTLGFELEPLWLALVPALTWPEAAATSGTP
ncbi:GNAT family N-acetyltransferase [Micrococcus endophyticus]|uniref:GNAT family N-acetyltransferase n=1 Tax=Micrococcus endophyticus TaxID=455343 RepID=UPI0034CE5015